MVSCDLDDTSMNNKDVISRLKKYPNLSFYFGKRVNKIEAVNRDINRHLNFDVLLVASDDMFPVLKNYDEIIINNMYKHFPNLDGVLHFNDGRVQEKLNTLAIMGKKYYNRFNYVYFPGYISVFCDTEMMIVSRILGKVVYIDQVIIRHDHPTFGFKPDALHIKNESKGYHKHDFKVLLDRKAVLFNLDKKDLIESKVYSSLDIFGCENKQVTWSILIPENESKKESFRHLYQELLILIHENKLASNIELLFSCDNSLSLENEKKLLISKCSGAFYSFIDSKNNKFKEEIKIIYNRILKSQETLNAMGIYKKQA